MKRTKKHPVQISYRWRTKLPFTATIKPLGLPEYRVEVYRSNGEVWIRLAP